MNMYVYIYEYVYIYIWIILKCNEMYWNVLKHIRCNPLVCPRHIPVCRTVSFSTDHSLTYGFIRHLPWLRRQGGLEFITLIPLWFFTIEWKVQQGWKPATRIPLWFFPIEWKVQQGWEFITRISLWIFPIEWKVQQGWEFITRIPLWM